MKSVGVVDAHADTVFDIILNSDWRQRYELVANISFKFGFNGFGLGVLTLISMCAGGIH